MDDVLVVGAGLGGLIAGAQLARRGFKVTVVERHYAAGGCATTFHRKSFTYEVSLHALDGLDAGDPKLPIFKELGILEHVPFVHVPRTEFFRFRHPDLDVTIPADFDAATRVLGDIFPRERRGLREFFRTIAEIRAGLAGVFLADGVERCLRMAAVPFRYSRIVRYWKTSIGDYLDQVFDDELLKLALISNLLYYNDDPRRLSLFWYSLAQGSFFAGGAHFIKGGSQVLSNYLAGFIRQHGGEVLLGQSVEEVLTEHGHAVGVRFRKALGSHRPEQVRYARKVIVNAPLPTAVNDLIHAPEIAAFRQRVNSLQKSCSFLSLFLGFRQSPISLGNPVYSTLLPGDSVSCPDDLVSEFRSKDWTRKGFEFVDYSQVDHGLAASGKSVGVISLVDYAANWDLPESEYREQKAYLSNVLLDRLERALPGARAALEHYEMATPRSVERFTGNPDGCIYGFEQNVHQSVPFRLDHTSPIRDLYFASAWVTPGGGYTGAMLAGMSCGRAVANDLLALQ